MILFESLRHKLTSVFRIVCEPCVSSGTWVGVCVTFRVNVGGGRAAK